MLDFTVANMESRLPKLTATKGGRIGKPELCKPKEVIPTERVKQIQTGRAKFDPGASTTRRIPLGRDIANLPSMKRAASPDHDKVSSYNFNRAKIRRSKSHNDLHSIKPMPVKKNEFTLPSAPDKKPKLTNGVTAVNVARRNGDSVKTVNGVRSKVVVNTKASSSASAIGDRKVVGAGTRTMNKIPPYDYKARFNALLEKHKALNEKYSNMSDQLDELESITVKLEEAQVTINKQKEDALLSQEEMSSLKSEMESKSMKINTLTKVLEMNNNELKELKAEHNVIKKAHDEYETEVVQLRKKSSRLEKEVGELSVALDETKELLFRSNLERKDLHNMVMDLRGNIRVFCRVRPPLEFEMDRLLCSWNYFDETSLEISNIDLHPATLKSKQQRLEFNFDQVFHPNCSQSDVFEMVSPLIQSALDGYNICIFAYGQTGSGKTYTMDGITEDIGIIPRTVDLLFESVKNYKRIGWEYEIKASFLEIYNEVLYDLLSNENKELEIRMVDRKNKTDVYVTNICEELVESPEHLRRLMTIAKQNRATASTVGNERSSRSHAVTRIELIGRHVEKNETILGHINLVDLAGSESPKTSTRMEETKKINKSLSELTNVILALLQKQEHIPYRNSKLTYLLMPSLGGNSKTLMFVNVSPFLDCFIESVKSLRFAANVNSCKMTKAKKNKFLMPTPISSGINITPSQSISSINSSSQTLSSLSDSS